MKPSRLDADASVRHNSVMTCRSASLQLPVGTASVKLAPATSWTCVCPLYSDDPGDEDLVIFLGPDAEGVPLEVMGIELADDQLLVIHAMKLRRKYRDAYRRVMECRGR